MSYEVARQIILDYWVSKGLLVKRDLKVPHATSKIFGHRMYLKPHTIHTDTSGPQYNLSNARATGIDNRQYAKNILKEVGMTLEQYKKWRDDMLAQMSQAQYDKYLKLRDIGFNTEKAILEVMK